MQLVTRLCILHATSDYAAGGPAVHTARGGLNKRHTIALHVMECLPQCRDLPPPTGFFTLSITVANDATRGSGSVLPAPPAVCNVVCHCCKSPRKVRPHNGYCQLRRVNLRGLQARALAVDLSLACSRGRHSAQRRGLRALATGFAASLAHRLRHAWTALPASSWPHACPLHCHRLRFGAWWWPPASHPHVPCHCARKLAATRPCLRTQFPSSLSDHSRKARGGHGSPRST